jgi:GAF domain-containing protein
MTGDRMAVVVRDLAANGIGRRRLPAAVSATCASLLDIEHSGLLLADHDGNLTALATTTPMMALVEDLEVTLGAGPCTDAYHHGRPVEETDLEGADHSRWLGFDSPALAAGVRAVFAFPLRVTDGSIGSLNLARLEPGALTGDQHLDAVALAGVVAQLLVTLPVDTAAGALELDDLVRHRAVVHQATGMVGAQFDVTMAVGLALLRARAFADDRSLDKVAADVVEHRLRFDT